MANWDYRFKLVQELLEHSIYMIRPDVDHDLWYAMNVGAKEKRVMAQEFLKIEPKSIEALDGQF